MNDKYDKPYLTVTVRHVTRDMSVGHVEKEDYYIQTDRLIPGEKVPMPAGVSLYDDYTVLKVNDEVVKLSRNGDEIVLDKDAGDDLSDTRTNITEASLNFSPGVCVFIMENLSFNVSFGVFGLHMTKESQITNGEDEGSRFSSGANFRFNLFNINFGIGVHI